MGKIRISYYLKSRNSEMREVIIKFNFGYKTVDSLTGKVKYKPFVYNTGVKTKIEFWNTDKGIPERKEDLAKVASVKRKLKTLYFSLQDQGKEISPQRLKVEMDLLLGRQKVQNSITRVYDFIYEFILEREEKKEQNEYRYSYNTRRNYRALNRIILEYENANNTILSAEYLDRDQYLDFQKKCQEKAGKSNTAWTHMKNLKATLKKIKRKYKVQTFDPAEELGHRERITFKVEHKTYFDFADIERIISFSTPDEEMRNVKLILLTLLFSGVRYSDVYKVIPEYTYKDKSIEFKYAHFLTTKNPTEVVIPFVKPLEDAMKKNNGKMARRISQNDFNYNVKILCKRIGFTTNKQLAYTNGKGVSKLERKVQYAFVSSHIGRRSFITNFINIVPPTLISKITGHQFKMKEVVFKYNKITPLKGAVLFMKFIKSLSKDKAWQDEFPILLVNK